METPPPGRRDNGLRSADWGALVDLDPRLSEGLLASLASAGVPAFVEPAAGANAWTRAVEMPHRPLDRLWVAPERADAAREVVSTEVADLTALLSESDPGATAHGLVQAVPRTAAARVLTPPVLPEPPARRPAATPTDATSPEEPSSEQASSDQPEPASPAEPAPAEDPDEVWRQIVEGFHQDASSPVPPWPVVEDVDTPRRTWTTRPERSGDEPPRRRRADRAAEQEGALPDWVEPEALEDDGHYVPPPPPPVPRLAPRKLAAAAVVVVGVLLMFAPGALLQPRTAGVGLFGVLLTLGGVGVLVWLMHDTPADEGPDGGAVV